MKIYKFLVVSALVVLANSCEEPMLLNPDETPRGIFVTYDPVNGSINSEDVAGTPVEGTFDVPANNVASHDIYVKRIYDSGESETDYIFLETITEFPYEFAVDGNELAELFDVPVEETFANFYEFNCEATGTNGQVASFDNLEGELISYPTQKQGFRFQAAVVCPSDPSLIVGTYAAVTSSTFPDFPDPVVDLEKTIVIAETADEGYYSISDFTFGTYDHFYAAAGWTAYADHPGTIQDVCGTYFIVDTADPWGEVGYGDFTFNDDGTITVVGGTSWGEEWTAVLTKQ